jgi:hypothetical protein
MVQQHTPCVPTVDSTPIEQADLLVCVDVLEHVPDPESFLEGIATRARVGTFLFEMTATHDHDTPLHLKANRGWHPGRCLERNGWWVVDRADRVRVWERKTETGPQTSSILACIYRSMSPATHDAILGLLQSNPTWRERVKSGDGLIPRSRSIITTGWSSYAAMGTTSSAARTRCITASTLPSGPSPTTPMLPSARATRLRSSTPRLALWRCIAR